MAKQLMSPRKVAIIVFAVVLVGAAVVISATTKRHYGGETPFENGERLGPIVGLVAGVLAAGAYFLQKRRIAQRGGRA